MMKLLDKPIDVMDDDELISHCTTFRKYASAMQYPDPTYIVMSEETNNLLTDLINEGRLSVWQAYKENELGYEYDDNGREFIPFPEADVIRAKYNI